MKGVMKMRRSNNSVEQDTRVLIDHTLENLGWKLTGKGKNVFFEQPKTEDERRKLDGKRPDYVLYSEDRPLIVIEAKRAGAKIDVALEQGIGYARVLNAPLVFATDGVFCKSFHTFANRTPILNGEEIDEFIRESLALRFLNSYEVNTISTKVQYDRKELISIFDEANNMLRGDGLRAGIERFGEFANILFLKLITENEQLKQERNVPSSFDISSCGWDVIRKIPLSARIDYINNVYVKLNNLYQTEIFTPLIIRDAKILEEIMDKLNPLTLTDVDSDVKGDAFEYFLRASASTKNDLGEYFTPRHIVKTMVRLVNPKLGEKIYDPFCGTGGFLIETFRYIERSVNSKNSDVRKTLTEQTIFGNEITNTARITKMNMILAGDGHSNIHMCDSLANPTYIDKIKYDKNEKILRDDDGNIVYSSEYSGIYDVVITNMPYSQRTRHGTLYDLPSTNGDSICVQHCIKAINSASENGRMAIIVPEGFLFRKDLTKAREYLLSRCQLQSIISLPQGVFLPYTGVKTDIIYATKVNQKNKTSDFKKNFWYFEVQNDGYTLDNHRRKQDKASDLAKYEEYRKLDESQSENMLKVGFESVSFDEVQKNSFILVGSRYRKQVAIKSRYETVTIGDVCEILSGYSFPLNLQGKLGEIPFYKVSDMNSCGNELTMIKSSNYVSLSTIKKQNWKIAPRDTIIFPKIGHSISTNKKRILSVPSLFDNNIMGLVCNEKILPQFLLYLLQTTDISEWASLANPPSIPRDVVLKHLIPLPPLEEQQKIALELDSYQKIVDAARRIVTSYRPDFAIKESWNFEKLGDVCEFEYGYTDSAKREGDTRFIRITDINPDGTLSNEDVKYTNLNNSNQKYLLSRGDILIARIGASYGKTLFFNEDFSAVFASYLIRLKFNSKIIPKYFFYYTQTQHYWKQAKFLVSGAAQPQFNANIIKLIQLPIPPIEEQARIVNQIEEEKALIESSKKIVETFTKKIMDKMHEILGE